MRLSVNGDPRETGAATLAALLAELGIDPQRVAVAVNGQVVPRGEWDRHRMTSGDRVEVITAVGGG